MESGTPVQGTRYGIVQWVERTTIDGHRHYRIVYRLVNEPQSAAGTVVLKEEQVYRDPHIGDVARIEFCLSRVLRMERGS